jgi:hypothetical protein
MSNQMSMNALWLAIKDLKIDVPIQSYDLDEEGRLIIYLYGGGVKHWPPLGVAVVKKEQPLNANMAKPPVTRSQLAKDKQSKSQRAKKSQ